MTASTPTDYARLTNRGKLRRLGRLATAALSQYDLRVDRVRLCCFATNPLYRVDSAGGERLILRLGYPGWRTLEDLRAEAAWLEALDRDTDVGAPRVVRSSDDDAVLPMSSGGVPGTWHATLMTWVDGRLLAHYLTDANLEKMGELFARLHIHGKTWRPPDGFTTERFEAYLSRGEPEALYCPAVLESLPGQDRETLLWARSQVEDEYASLDRNDLRVIHCDLWHENIKLDRGRLRPFDFEDTIWGYRLHDIAMGMLDLLETVGAARYQVLLAAFRAGYERLLDWPAGRLEALQIGRMLWQLNYTARFNPGALLAKVAGHCHAFAGYERTGTLRLTPG